MNKSQMHLSVSEMGVPEYRINPGGGEMFAVLDLGLIQLFIFDPAELRRLADVAANAADVLEQAQDEQAKASKCPAKAHDMIRANDHLWGDLEFVGYQDDGQGERLELRNCPCGATLAILARESPSGAEGAGLARVAG